MKTAFFELGHSFARLRHNPETSQAHLLIIEKDDRDGRDGSVRHVEISGKKNLEDLFMGLAEHLGFSAIHDDDPSGGS